MSVVVTVAEHESSPSDAKFNDNGRLIATTTLGGVLRVIDAKTGSLVGACGNGELLVQAGWFDRFTAFGRGPESILFYDNDRTYTWPVRSMTRAVSYNNGLLLAYLDGGIQFVTKDRCSIVTTTDDPVFCIAADADAKIVVSATENRVRVQKFEDMLRTQYEIGIDTYIRHMFYRKNRLYLIDIKDRLSIYEEGKLIDKTITDLWSVNVWHVASPQQMFGMTDEALITITTTGKMKQAIRKMDCDHVLDMYTRNKHIVLLRATEKQLEVREALRMNLD